MDLHLLGQRRQSATTYECWDFLNADLDGLQDALDDLDWHNVISCDEVNAAVEAWTTTFLKVTSKYVPLKRITKRAGAKPWYSPFLHRLSRCRDRLFHRWKKNTTNAHYADQYRRVRNWYVAELRNAERAFYRTAASALSAKGLRGTNPHLWWNKVKTICGFSASDNIPPIANCGSLHFQPSEKARVLNAAFAAQCSASGSSTLPVFAQQKHSAEFAFPEFSEVDVITQLKALNVWKASGVDSICNRLLKFSSSAISLPLAHIFNLSLRTGVFPQRWKKARIQPIYKQKGDRSSASNYRPIALLCSVSKVFERLVKGHLLNFCICEEIIPEQQFGFLPGRSTVWQLLTVLEDWHSAIDKGELIHAAFLDVAKAFDRVDHRILLAKLHSVGFAEKPLAWFTSYLSDRTIITAVDHVDSPEQSITSGVPQGSVLGPLLFVIYMAELPSSVKSSSCALFADDTLAYSSGCKLMHFPCCSLQGDVDMIHDWSVKWNTLFNASKSQQMVITSRRQESTTDPQLCLGGHAVKSVSSTKHLGVYFTNNLSWSMHISKLIQKVAPKVVVLKRLAYRAQLSPAVLGILYKTLVRSCLEYASVAWDDCSVEDSHKLERIQLSLARAALPGCKKEDLLCTLDWPTLSWRRRRSKAIYFWQLMNRRGPPNLTKQLPETVEVRCEYSLRNARSVQLPLCSLSSRQRSFLPSAASLWNSLPVHVSADNSLSSFISSLDLHFFTDRYTFGLPT